MPPDGRGFPTDESRASVVRRPSVPSSWLRAARSESRVCAEMRSITPSAWVRSSLPLRNARRVNSPGPAGTAPQARKRASTSRVDQDAAVAGELHAVLAGVAVRARENREQPVVDDFSVRRRVPCNGARMRGGWLAVLAVGGQVRHADGIRSGNPDHGNRAHAGRRGDRGNGRAVRVGDGFHPGGSLGGGGGGWFPRRRGRGIPSR